MRHWMQRGQQIYIDVKIRTIYCFILQNYLQEQTPDGDVIWELDAMVRKPQMHVDKCMEISDEFVS